MTRRTVIKEPQGLYGTLDLDSPFNGQKPALYRSISRFVESVSTVAERCPKPERVSSVYVEDLRGQRLIGIDRSGWEWSPTLERGLAGAPEMGTIDVSLAADDGSTWTHVARVGATANAPRFPGVADEVSFAVYGGDSSPEVARQVVEWLVWTAREMRVARGFITQDFWVAPDPYAAAVGVNSLDVLRSCDETVRGYYWGLLLSDRHVKRLGGLPRVLADAPVYRAEDVSLPDHTLVYLQLTERPDMVEERHLAQLRDFLQPVLRPRDPDRWCLYIGPSLRLAETDLAWANRRRV